MPDKANHDHEHGGDEHRNHGHKCSTSPSALMVELREHVPFSVSAAAIGLIVAGMICIIGNVVSGGALLDGAHTGHGHAPGEAFGLAQGPAFAQHFFHLFHPAHMLFSAAATSAMFVRYDRNVVKAIVVGLIGAIGVCGISDIVMPHAALVILGTQTPWHICVVEHPSLVLPFAGIGVLVGIGTAGGVVRSTFMSHTLHVLTSTMASIFYMVGPLGLVAWIDRVGVVFIFIIIAVVTPCCLSDIVFPMFMTKSGRSRYEQEPHAH